MKTTHILDVAAALSRGTLGLPRNTPVMAIPCALLDIFPSDEDVKICLLQDGPYLNHVLYVNKSCLKPLQVVKSSLSSKRDTPLISFEAFDRVVELVLEAPNHVTNEVDVTQLLLEALWAEWPEQASSWDNLYSRIDCHPE